MSTVRRSVLALVVLGAASLGAACSGESSTAPSCSTYEATTTVETLDFDYGPRCIEAEEGAELTIDNTGEAPHTFTVDGTELSADVPAGEQGTLVLTGVTSGTTYTVTCIYHSQMTASLRIG